MKKELALAVVVSLAALAGVIMTCTSPAHAIGCWTTVRKRWGGRPPTASTCQGAVSKEP